MAKKQIAAKDPASFAYAARDAHNELHEQLNENDRRHAKQFDELRDAMGAVRHDMGRLASLAGRVVTLEGQVAELSEKISELAAATLAAHRGNQEGIEQLRKDLNLLSGNVGEDIGKLRATDETLRADLEATAATVGVSLDDVTPYREDAERGGKVIKSNG